MKDRHLLVSGCRDGTKKGDWMRMGDPPAWYIVQCVRSPLEVDCRLAGLCDHVLARIRRWWHWVGWHRTRRTK